MNRSLSPPGRGMFFGVVCMCCLLPARAQAAPKHTWLFGGQSNMKSDVMDWRFEEMLEAHMPGIELAFPCSRKSGTNIREWFPEGSMHKNLMGVIDKAPSDIAGMIWYQGENNSAPEYCHAYYDDLTRFIKMVRDATGKPKLPFVVVQIGILSPNNRSRADEWGWTIVREAQRRVAEEDPNVEYLSAISDSGNYVIHVSHELLRDLGTLSAKYALSKVYGKDPADFPYGLRLKDTYFLDGRRDKVVIEFKGVDGSVALQDGYRQGLAFVNDLDLPSKLKDWPALDKFPDPYTGLIHPAHAQVLTPDSILVHLEKPLSKNSRVGWAMPINAMVGKYHTGQLGFRGIVDGTGYPPGSFAFVKISDAPRHHARQAVRIDIEPSKITLKPGATIRLSGRVLDGSGKPTATQPELRWQTNVGTIDGSNLLAPAMGDHEGVVEVVAEVDGRQVFGAAEVVAEDPKANDFMIGVMTAINFSYLLGPHDIAGAPGYEQTHWNNASQSDALFLMDSSGRSTNVGLDIEPFDHKFWAPGSERGQVAVPTPDRLLMDKSLKTSFSIVGLESREKYNLVFYWHPQKTEENIIRVSNKGKPGPEIKMMPAPEGRIGEGAFRRFVEAAEKNGHRGNYIVFKDVAPDNRGRIRIQCSGYNALQIVKRTEKRPEVRITSPREGAKLDGQVVLSANVDGDLMNVQFYVLPGELPQTDEHGKIPEYWKSFPLDQLVGQADTAPYTVTWNPPEAGTYTVMTRAVNRHGISGFSQPVVIHRTGE